METTFRHQAATPGLHESPAVVVRSGDEVAHVRQRFS